MSAHMEDSSTGAPPVTVSGSHLQVDKVKAAYWQQFIDELSSMGVTFEDLDPDSDFKAILCETKLTPIQQGIVLKMIKERLGGTTVTGGRSGSAASSTSTAGQIEELRQEMRQEMRALRFATRQVTSPTIIPTIFTQSQFKKHLHDYQSWKSYSGPWWNSIVDFPKTSETFAQFCSVKLPAVGANEDALQAYLMQQLATLQNKKSSLLKCSFIDTHSKPLMDTTRKLDVAMLPKPMEKPSIYNLAAMISLKRKIDEGAVVELAFMLLDLLTSTPRRQMISGIVTNCREWQAVWITRRDGGFEYRRSKIFELHPPNKKNEISADRQAVLQFLLQDPYAAGLNAPTTFSTGDQRWNTWQLSSGSTSTVRVGEPLIEPYKHPNVVLKQLMVRDDKRHEKFFHAECEVLQLLSEQAPPELSLCLPRLIGVIKEDWTLVVSPVGLRLHSSSITPEFVEEMFVYIKGMWKMKLVDLDLRGRNIMMVLDKSDVGHFFKVDFASVVRAGAELTEYHGTDRYAHPDILSALIKTKPGVASSSSSSSPAALQSPTSASSFSLQFIPNQSHMLYSAAATVLWLIHLSDVHKELIRAAGNDWVQLLQAWSEVRKEDIQAGELLTLAETGKVDESSRLLAKIAGTVQTSRGRSPSQ